MVALNRTKRLSSQTTVGILGYDSETKESENNSPENPRNVITSGYYKLLLFVTMILSSERIRVL